MPRDIDRILDAWFEEGPTLSADRVVGAALSQAEQVRQTQPGLRRSPSAADRRWRSTFALVAATVAIAITLVGIGFASGILRIDRTPPPPPVESPDATASATTPAGFELFSSELDGYELLIPTSWSEIQSDFGDARQWAGPDGELMISYGTSIFEGGQVTICAPPLPDYNTCMTIDHGFSVPFDPAVDGVGPIPQEVWLDRCDGGCPVTTTEVNLDGETASLDRAVITERQLTYVSTFHNRRPVIVYWSEPLNDADRGRIEQMLASFRFIDPGEQPPFEDPTELVLHTDEDAGYELLLPRFWETDSREVPRGEGTVPGVMTFSLGSGFGTRESPGLTISVGEEDGSIFLCQPGCRRIEVSSLDELEAAISSRFEEAGDAAPQETSGDAQLGGEPARWERPNYRQNRAFAELGIGAMVGGGNCLGCPNMKYHIFTFHNGRPVVLAFDYWNIAFERLQDDYVAQIIESFRFTD
jgi:hypothetical protein